MLKKVKKHFIIVNLILLVLILSSCNETNNVESKKKTIMTTLFPQYDFVRQIAGDKFEVQLLLPPGSSSHSYEPAPKDIIDINNSEMLVYTGKDMEAWVATILESVDNEELKVLDLSEGIELLKTGEAEHGHNHGHEEAEHEEEEHEEKLGHGHSHDVDPHFFASPKNAVIMMDKILEEIIKLDPKNEQYYRDNHKKYVEEIEKVDARLHHIAEESENKTLYFGGKFAMLYFVNEYNLSYVSPFSSCSHESEADPKSIVEIIECMKEHHAKTVYYEELAEPKVANMMAEEIGGKALLLHSCHNVSKDEFEKGVTYVDLMNQNADNLEKGLK